MVDVAIRNLLFDSADGIEIFDTENDRVMTNAEVDAKIAEICFQYTGLTKDSTDKQIRNALKSEKAREFFAIIEEIIERKVTLGYEGLELFREFVDEVNVAEGDKPEWWAERETYLQVEKVSGNSHDLVIQKLAQGEPYTVPTGYYGVKVGQDIKLFLLGRKSWSAFIDAVAKAFINLAQEQITSKFVNAASSLSLPSEFTDSGALAAATKGDFDTLIENVSMANGNCPVIILGTKTALKKMNNLTNNSTAVTWMASSQKEAIAHTGILGDYEGSTLIEIPNRFTNINDI